MKVILLAAVRGLGKIGDMKEVSDGYAHNFLFPKKLARNATKSAIQSARIQKETVAIRKSLAQKEASDLAQSLRNKELVFSRKTENGRLFGSVTEKDILQEISRLGYTTESITVIVSHPIKEIGEHAIQLRIKEMNVPVTIRIQSS